MTNCRYSGHEEAYNCVKGSLGRNEFGYWFIKGHSGKWYRISCNAKKHWKISWENWQGIDVYYGGWSMKEVLDKMSKDEKEMESPPKQPKVTYTDRTKPQPHKAPLKVVPKITADLLEEEVDKLNGEVKRMCAENEQHTQFRDSIAQLFCLFGDEVDSDYLIKVVQATIKRARDQLDDLAKARDMISGRMAQINRLETACRNHRIEVAQLEKQLGIYEWARAMMEVVR